MQHPSHHDSNSDLVLIVILLLAGAIGLWWTREALPAWRNFSATVNWQFVRLLFFLLLIETIIYIIIVIILYKKNDHSGYLKEYFGIATFFYIFFILIAFFTTRFILYKWSKIVGFFMNILHFLGMYWWIIVGIVLGLFLIIVTFYPIKHFIIEKYNAICLYFEHFKSNRKNLKTILQASEHTLSSMKLYELRGERKFLVNIRKKRPLLTFFLKSKIQKKIRLIENVISDKKRERHILAKARKKILKNESRKLRREFEHLKREIREEER